jgi:hypothetical protein
MSGSQKDCFVTLMEECNLSSQELIQLMANYFSKDELDKFLEFMEAEGYDLSPM